MPRLASQVRLQITHFGLNLLQQVEIARAPSDDLAPVGDVLFEERAPCISHTADVGHTDFETGLVTAKIIAHQLAPQSFRT